MAIGDIPKFPREFRPRGDKLIQLIQEGEISSRDVLNNAISTMGKISIGSHGIEITGSYGSFEIDSDDFAALMESVNKMVDFMPTLLRGVMGHELIMKVGDRVTKLQIKIPPRVVPSSTGEIRETDIPSLEMPGPVVYGKPCGPILEFFASYIGEYLPPNGKLINVKIRRAEELVGWLGEGWDFLAKVIDVAVPALQLTSKQSMDRLGKFYAAFWDELFKKCGV